MPQVSRFYGISIYLYYRDHPPPHFHAIYGDEEAVFSIASGELIEGELRSRAEKLVREWAKERRTELNRAWNQARESQPLDPIPPLDE